MVSMFGGHFLPFSGEAPQWYGLLVSRCERQSRPIYIPDALITSTTETNGAQLATYTTTLLRRSAWSESITGRTGYPTTPDRGPPGRQQSERGLLRPYPEEHARRGLQNDA